MANPAVQRITVDLPRCAYDRLSAMSDDRGLSMTATIRLSLGLLDAFDRAQAAGHFVGTSPDREVLRTVFVTPV